MTGFGEIKEKTKYKESEETSKTREKILASVEGKHDFKVSVGGSLEGVGVAEQKSAEALSDHDLKRLDEMVKEASKKSSFEKVEPPKEVDFINFNTSNFSRSLIPIVIIFVISAMFIRIIFGVPLSAFMPILVLIIILFFIKSFLKSVQTISLQKER